MDRAQLAVEVDGDEIVVTRPGVLFAYRKCFDEPRLVLTRSLFARSQTAASINRFRIQAFQVAVAKARELGWIV